MKIVAIIQARMGSTRLPGKVLMDVCGKPILQHVIERIKLCKTIDFIVVATTTGLEDKDVTLLAERLGVGSFAGSSDDVLDRYYQAAKKYEADIIVRITADCPLIDPRIVDRVVKHLLENGYDVCGHGGGFPDGLDVDVFTFKTLEKTWTEANLLSEREHVCPFMHNHPELFSAGTYVQFEGLENYRWTVDESRDIELIRRIYALIKESGKQIYYAEDILELITENPELININRGIIRNEGYLISLEKDKKEDSENE